MYWNCKMKCAGLVALAAFCGPGPAWMERCAADGPPVLAAASEPVFHVPRPRNAPQEASSTETSAEPSRMGTPADANANPYAIIVDRNVFRLNPPPPPPEPEAPKLDLPTVNLSGFQKIGNEVHVFMAITPKDTKQARIFFNLRQSEKGGEPPNTLEVVKIHPNLEEVDVLLAGTPMLLSLKSNSFASAGAPKAPAGRENKAPGGTERPGTAHLEHRGPGASPSFHPRAAQPFGGAPPTSSTATGSGSGGSSGSSSSGVYVGGASASPQAAQTGATYVGGASPGVSFSSGGSTYVGGASPMTAGGIYTGGASGVSFSGSAQPGQAPGTATLDLNPTVPGRAAQSQINWPPVVQTSPVQQAASMLIQEAAGGPPVPPGLMPNGQTETTPLRVP